MDFSAQFEKYINRCSECAGLGIGKNSAPAVYSCPSCRGSGLVLKLPDSDLVTTLPLFVDFGGRTRARVIKIFLMFLASIFIIGVPYAIFIYALNFIGRLSKF